MSGVSGSWLQRWGEELIAGVASGILLALCFPPFPTRFFVIFALVPVLRYYIVRYRAAAGPATDAAAGPGWVKRSLFLGFVLGVVFFTTLLFWIVNLIPESGVSAHWILFPALILLVLYLSCYTMLFTLGLSALARRLGVAAVFAAPTVWTLTELARSHGELGFSWGDLAYAFAIYPDAIQGASVYGPFGLAFVLVLLNVLCAFAFFARSRARRAVALILFVALGAGHLMWGHEAIARFDRGRVEIGPPKEVAVVQPNVSLKLKFEGSMRDSIFVQMAQFAKEAASQGSMLVIFPETAAPVSFKVTPSYLTWLERMARENRIDILTGFIDHTLLKGQWEPQNAAALIDHRGRLAATYAKMNLLPFGEKMPFSQYLPVLREANFGQANFIPGATQTIFDSSAGRFGVLICFESTFSGFTRRYVREGAEFLVNITNDGWFGGSRGPIQHAEMAILRSVENRVTLFRSAYTGVSMVVDPMGRVLASLPTFTSGMIYGTVERMPRHPIYERFGYLAYWIMIAVNMLLVYAWTIRGRRRARGAGAPRAASDERSGDAPGRPA
jgi:apolipoprotein N-acyltransferase